MYGYFVIFKNNIFIIKEINYAEKTHYGGYGLIIKDNQIVLIKKQTVHIKVN